MKCGSGVRYHIPTQDRLHLGERQCTRSHDDDPRAGVGLDELVLEPWAIQTILLFQSIKGLRGPLSAYWNIRARAGPVSSPVDRRPGRLNGFAAFVIARSSARGRGHKSKGLIALEKKAGQEAGRDGDESSLTHCGSLCRYLRVCLGARYAGAEEHSRVRVVIKKRAPRKEVRMRPRRSQ